VSGRSGAVPGLSGSDWAGEGAERWSAEADRLEAMLAPVDDEALLPAAAPTAGERVLDVGCGRGVTTRTAAVLTGPSGAVTGVDIAARLIEEATLVPVPAGSSPISWVTADAATQPFPGGGFDVVVSRFGPLAMVLDGAPPEVVDPVLAELVEELHRRWDGTGVPLQAAIAVVSARH